jgi:hypothetical protein
VTLDPDGGKSVWGNLGPDNIYVKITPASNGTLHMEGTVGPFSWQQTIEPLPRG